MTNLISVIVPVYNAEQYLERCVNSICNQTYKNLEIILVNDGSSDNSRSICEKLAKEDDRIKVINQKNGGSSIARNTGLDNATGDVISFVDSDDYILDEMLETMLKLMNEHNLEVVEIERNDESGLKKFDNSFKIENHIESVERIIIRNAFQVWKRIYKRSVVEDMRFIPNIIHQDVFFTIDTTNKVKNIGYLNTPFYIYNRDSEGIIRSKYSAMKRDVGIRATKYIQNNVPDHPRIKRVMDIYTIHYYTDHYFLLSRNTKFDKDGFYRKMLKKEIIKYANGSKLPLRPRLVVNLPQKIMEWISAGYQRIKKS